MRNERGGGTGQPGGGEREGLVLAVAPRGSDKSVVRHKRNLDPRRSHGVESVERKPWKARPGGGVDENYSFSYINGTLTVDSAAVTCTADDKARAYGSANPALTISSTPAASNSRVMACSNGSRPS